MSDLILVPTQREMDVVRPLLIERLPNQVCNFQICGFGPIASAARTGALLSRYRPDRVVLMGIAGGYGDQWSVGSAHRFDSVACDGVGVGNGIHFQSAGELGWQQFNGDETAPCIGDRVELDSSYIQGVPSSGLALTCCAASANRDEAEQRLARYPDAVVEEMEGFGVALACSLAGTPVQIVRGISNRVGDRDHERWEIEPALVAAVELAGRLIPEIWMPVL